MREVDRLTTERYGIPSILLMENAAHAVARVITEKLGGSVKGKSILILCGKGNNGGDGAALARILWKDGAFVSFLFFGKISDTNGDARTNLDILKKIETDVVTSGGTYNKLLVHEEDKHLSPLLEGILGSDELDLVVDALFGTGLTRELSGTYPEIIQRLENHSPNIISIDIPSGLNADQGDQIGRNISATTTVTFTAPKTANVVPPASGFNGELVIANIGSPQELIDEQNSQMFVTEAWKVELWFKQAAFTTRSYKNKRGHALVIAGSESYSGAAVLVGDAAMRSGVGLVTIATPKSSKDSIAARVLPEVMVKGVAETAGGAVAEEAFDELCELLEKADSVAVGSGLSQDESTRRFVQKVIANRKCPTIVDADALNLISPLQGPQSEGPPKGGTQSLIFTPHEGEFMRLLGTTEKDAIKDRVAAVREFSQKHNIILVLKGERVLIGEPGGKVVVNPTGNSGLGKAGNGDTLTGILAGFVAQAAAMDIDIFETVIAAVYIAGMAGDVAEKKYGKRVMTASDVRECLTEVFAEFESQN
ncbi:NAD(P)H-hydrate dehydratase [soil metagenome]